MMRAVLGVIAGYAAWTVIWLGGNTLLFSEGQAYTTAGPLAGVIVLSVVCSIVAGLLAARIAGERARGAVMVTAVLLLLTGIGVQAGVWSLMPLWYHLVFLVLIVPVVCFGGRFGRPRAA